MNQTVQKRPERSRHFYILSGIGVLLSVLLVAAAFYFREELQHVQGYGYIGVFIIGVLCGVTIIPAPTLLMVFTLGSVWHPLYIGLVAGFGGAIGGITVYMTGAGMGTIWSMFRFKKQTSEHPPDQSKDMANPVQSRFWSRGESLYNRLTKWMGGSGGYWTLFISSALIVSPFYFAGIAAGSLRMGLLRFFLISWAGKTVRYLTVAYAGYWGLHFILKWIGA